MGYPAGFVVDAQNIPQEWFCSICSDLVIPDHAIQASCLHLFCTPCMYYRRISHCPVCHTYISPVLRPMMEYAAIAIHHTPVYCLFYDAGCPWVGSLAASAVHLSQCAYADEKFVCEICAAQLSYREHREHFQTCPATDTRLPETILPHQRAYMTPMPAIEHLRNRI